MPLTRLSPLAFLAWASPSLADNPYAAAGISEPAHVTQFLARLKQAMAADDRAALAAMVNYPLRVHAVGRPVKTYRNAAALRASYPNVFTPDVVEAVGRQNPMTCLPAIRAL